MLSTESYTAIEATRVMPGILPPIIRTTPNSPSVWANVSTAAVNRDGLIFGSKTCLNVCHSDFPRVYEACASDRGNCCNADRTGPIINGMLYITDASTNPWKENIN